MAESVVLELNLKIARLERKLAAAERRMSRTEKRFKAIGNQIRGHLAGMFAIGAIHNFARSQVELIKKIDQSNRALKAITGTTEEYNRAKTMLRVSAEEFGIRILDLTKSYVRFYAASKASTLSTKELDTIFNKVSKSSAVLGLSADETHGVLKALEQMMSKGKVQAEELRGQLGDRLPGAFVIMAQSMGITTGELDNMLKKGGVIADEVLPKFAEEYEKAIGADQIDKVKTLVSEFGRLNTAWTLFTESVDTGGGLISGAVGIFTDWLTVIAALNDKTIEFFDDFLWNTDNINTIADRVREKYKEIADDATKEADRIEKAHKEFFQGLIDGGVTMEEFESRLSDAKNGTILYNDEVRESVMTLDMMNAILSKYNEKGKKEAEIANKRAEAAKKLNDEYQQIADSARVSMGEQWLVDAIFPSSPSGITGSDIMDGIPGFDEWLSGADNLEDIVGKNWAENMAQSLLNATNIVTTAVDEAGEEMIQNQINITDAFAGIFGAGLSASIQAIRDGKSMKAVFGALFETMGDAMVQYGVSMIALGTAQAIFGKAVATLNPGQMIAAGTGLVIAGSALSSAFGRVQKAAGGSAERTGGGRGFQGTQTSQSIQFEPIMLRLQGKDLVGAIRVNDRDASL